MAAVAVGAAPAPVRAQSTRPSDAATERQELIAQAQQARDAGDHAAALAIAQRAAALGLTPSLRLFVGQEQFAVGRHAEALENAEQCRREARADAALRNRDVIAATCGLLAETLRSRSGWLVVRVPPPAPARLEVTVAGVALEPTRWNAPHALPAGTVVLEARAPGRRTLRRAVALAPGRQVAVLIALDPLGVAAVPALAAAAAPRRAGSGGAWALVGTGGALLSLAGVALALNRAALAQCPDGGCPDAGVIDRVYAFGAVTWAAAGAGVLAATAGLAWWLAARGAPRAARPVSLHAAVGAGVVALGLAGTL